jgi:hypothetical protein
MELMAAGWVCPTKWMLGLFEDDFDLGIGQFFALEGGQHPRKEDGAESGGRDGSELLAARLDIKRIVIYPGGGISFPQNGIVAFGIAQVVGEGSQLFQYLFGRRHRRVP